MQHGQIGELVCTSGIIVRTSQPSVIKLKKKFKCKKCQHVSIIKVIFCLLNKLYIICIILNKEYFIF